MKYPKLRELKHAVIALIKGPYTSKFPFEPHVPAPGFRGKPVPDTKECIACGACANVCPARAIEIVDRLETNPPQREVIWHYDLCIYCGQCERLCTTEKGVKLSAEFDLATMDRSTLWSKIEKELVICEDCGAIVGAREHLQWLAKKLGPLSSGNINLTYAEQQELNVSHDIKSGLKNADIQRSDLYRVLCPKCRHLVLVFNQTGKQP
ncbi:MAG: hypothetical protein A2219_05035 [Elusimicrobia bacterium RIFOXYA2_FULL_50_26]|nr:MAG: hypothetical protein A2219_05035 [Elusimicrobia bacterium RIFOXYA2_FULL_50_26]OGS22868.1 MAG: hypothetical protein A2314_02355 [Elusimicrobia bacterium RIFOXYB2_FULL_50_12]